MDLQETLWSCASFIGFPYRKKRKAEEASVFSKTLPFLFFEFLREKWKRKEL